MESNHWCQWNDNGFGETSIGLDGIAKVFNSSQPLHWPNDLLLYPMVLMVGKQPMEWHCFLRDSHKTRWNGDGFAWSNDSLVTVHRPGLHITDVLISLLTDLPQLSLNGLNSIIGRGVVVHAGRDDMGRVRQITNFYFYFSLCDMHVFKEILRAEMMAV